MAPSSWPDPGGGGPGPLLPADAERLLDLAETSINDGLADAPLELVDTAVVPPALRRPAGTFVTLHVGGTLNGCIGSIETGDPLVHSVPRHARSAAFDDPRLPPLTADDLDALHIEISILSGRVPIGGDRRDELLAALRPRVDGLLIESGHRRAVFLPTVWATLSTPEHFVGELLTKAGLDGRRWPDELRAWTFTTETVEREPSPN